MPVPYLPPNVKGYTRTPSHNHMCSTVGAQVVSVTFRTAFFGFFFLAKPDLRVEPEGVGLRCQEEEEGSKRRRRIGRGGPVTGGQRSGEM
jgi:hypothetical protein